MIFKIMNYLSLNTNFALKLQGKCWKDDVIMCSADHTEIKMAAQKPQSKVSDVLQGLI